MGRSGCGCRKTQTGPVFMAIFNFIALKTACVLLFLFSLFVSLRNIECLKPYADLTYRLLAATIFWGNESNVYSVGCVLLTHACLALLVAVFCYCILCCHCHRESTKSIRAFYISALTIAVIESAVTGFFIASATNIEVQNEQAYWSVRADMGAREPTQLTQCLFRFLAFVYGVSAFLHYLIYVLSIIYLYHEKKAITEKDNDEERRCSYECDELSPSDSDKLAQLCVDIINKNNSK